MKIKKMKTDSGVAGLTILLSVVTMLFVIGLLVMIFVLMGGELSDATYDSTAVAVTGENVLNASLIAGSPLSDASVDYTHATCTINSVTSETADGQVLLVGNYTISTCDLSNATGYIGATGWFVNYTVTYDASNTATDVMNETSNSIGTVTDWFPIFIVITAMVVLILLTVIIITAIRGSGLMAGESA